MPLPKLTTGFIQRFVSGDSNVDEQPNLQVLDMRPVGRESDDRFRFRLSDGQFIFNTCINQSQVAEKIRHDNLAIGTPIIHLTRWMKSIVSGNRLTIVVCDYKLVAKGAPKIGEPTVHSGNARDYPPAEPSHPTVSTGGVELGTNKGAQGQQTAAKRHHITSDYRHNDHIENSNHSMPTRVNPSHQNITPIKMITPFINRWKICGRVVEKDEEIRTVKTARADFRVFNFELVDEQASRIRVGVFNDLADRYFHIIHLDCMYYLSGAMVKKTNPQYNRTGHQYELSLRTDSEVMPCKDRNIAVPKLAYNFMEFDKLAENLDSLVDVLGVVVHVDELKSVRRRDSEEMLDKRDVQIMDQNGTTVVLTFWAEKANSLPFLDDQYPIIGFKDVKVREFQGINLSATPSTKIEKNPDCEESFSLTAWLNSQDNLVQLNTLSRLGSLANAPSSVKEFRMIEIAELAHLGEEEKGAYFRLNAYVSTVNDERALYKACPNDDCKKKVIEVGGQWRCEKCNSTSDNYKYLFLLSLELCDLSGAHWVTMFDEQAQKLLQVPTQDLGKLLIAGQQERYCSYFNRIKFRRFEFKIRAKTENYNDEQRVKWVVIEVNQVSVDQYISLLKEATLSLEAI